MRTQMMTSIMNCAKCRVFEKREPKAPLCSIVATEPMDLIHVDLLGLETMMDLQTQPVVQKVLVITDHFSHHVQAYKVSDKHAITIAKCLSTTSIFIIMVSPRLPDVRSRKRVLQQHPEGNVLLLKYQES